jgi:hypothetical protein
MNDITTRLFTKTNTLLIAGIAVLIGCIYLFSQYALLYVTVDMPASMPKVTDFDKVDHRHESEQTSKSGDGADYRKNIIAEDEKVAAKAKLSVMYDDAYKESGEPGLHIVKRTASAASVSAGNTATSTALRLPWYGFKHAHLALKLDTNADKLAYKSSLRSACGVYSEALERVSQYSCTSPRVLSVYNTPLDNHWLVDNIAELSYQRQAFTQYQGGLIGLAIDPSNENSSASIQAVSAEGASANYPLPNGMQCLITACALKSDNLKLSELQSYPSIQFFTDTKDQTNTRFAIAASDGTLYLAQTNQGDVSYRKIDAPKEYNPHTQQTKCDVNKEKVYCYRGLADNPSNGQVSSKDTPTSLYIYNFNSNEEESYKLRDNLSVNFFGITSQNKIFYKEKNTLTHLQLDQKKPREVVVAKNIDKVSAGGSAYYTYSGGVYKVENETLNTYQVFHSDHISPQQLTTTKDSVVILGYAPQNNSTTTYAWKLNNQENLTPGLRLIDRLPSAPSSVAFATTDLVGSRIYIQVPMDRSKPLSYIKEKQEEVLQNLRESGIDTSELETIKLSK